MVERSEMESRKDNSPFSDKQGKMDKSKGSLLRVSILLLLMAFCIVFYYFGELVDWAAWNALRVNFFYGMHDVHRLLFLAPIIYSAYYFGIKATVIITIITLMSFLPRALFISPYPDPLLRMIIFSVIAGVLGYLVAAVRRETKRRIQLEAMLKEISGSTTNSGEPG